MSQALFDTNFRNFQNYYFLNKDKPWSDWLVPVEQDERMDGKQGYVGKLRHPHNKSLSCLYKISKVDDNLAPHEYKILRGLDLLAQYCPHFHRVYGMIPFDCNLHYENNPLVYNKNSKIVQREMILMQYIQSKCDLHSFIRDDTNKDDWIVNILKQVIIAIYMSHEYEFTHYDLHTENILIRSCNPNMNILYILNEHDVFLTPTFGYIPNIIDFGFSYCTPEPEMSNDLTCTLVHTQHGFTSTRFDPYADIKLFLVSTTDDIHKETERKNLSQKLRNIVRNVFSGMNIQWSSGWDNSKLVSPIKIVQELIRDIVKPSALFSKSDLWFDTIQELIILPLNPMSYQDLETSCRSFIEEFVKFEERIISKTLLNYVLKVFVRCVKTYRSSYLKGGDESSWALLEIKKEFLNEYTSLVNYHVPSIDFEKMVCSLLLFAQCLEGLYYDTLQKRFTEKDKQYDLMRCKDLLDFYRILDYAFPIKHQKAINLKSQILVVDHMRKKCETISLNKENVQLFDRLKDPKLMALYAKNIYESKSVY